MTKLSFGLDQFNGLFLTVWNLSFSIGIRHYGIFMMNLLSSHNIDFF